MKSFALILALALPAPLAAQAATLLTPHGQLLQKLHSTYHTSFPQRGT
jgi:hypothetical protein